MRSAQCAGCVPGSDSPGTPSRPLPFSKITGILSKTWCIDWNGQIYVSEKVYDDNFHVKAFKKGTIHLLFKDEALWAKFNVAVNKGKNQIGEAE